MRTTRLYLSASLLAFATYGLLTACGDNSSDGGGGLQLSIDAAVPTTETGASPAPAPEDDASPAPVDAAPDVAADAAPVDAAPDADAAPVDAGPPQGCHGEEFHFDDDFSQGLRPAYWTTTETPVDAGVFGYDENNGELHFFNTPTATYGGNLRNISASLDLVAAGGPVLDDFSIQVDFKDAVVGASGIDQIELHARFAGSKIFYIVYSQEAGNPYEFHVWDGNFRTGFQTAAKAGKLRISRVDDTLTAYATVAGDGGQDVEQVVYTTTQTNKPELTYVDFVAQNFNTNNKVSVTFDNFHLQGKCAPPDAGVDSGH